MRSTLVLDVMAPIPVGHRVRVERLERRAPDGNWTPTSDVALCDEETGVEYVPARYCSREPDNEWYGKELYLEDLADGWRRNALFVGRVVQCRVVGAGRALGYVTRLVLERDAQQPYR